MSWEAYRVIIFALGLMIFTLLGWWVPRRKEVSRPRRQQLHNVIMGGINPMFVRLLLSWGLIEWAVHIQNLGYGLLNQFQGPHWISLILFVFAMDGIIYWQHRWTHKIPLLWRLHRVHHTDTEMDSTTALRFHCLEIVLSFVFKIGAIFVVGGDPMAVFVFEVLLNFSAMFNHANWALPLKWDLILRKVIVTPDFHRIHHSSIPLETDSNYGFFLSIWDFVFRSYTPEPKNGQLEMEVGLKIYRDPKSQKFWNLLSQPFRKT